MSLRRIASQNQRLVARVKQTSSGEKHGARSRQRSRGKNQGSSNPTSQRARKARNPVAHRRRSLRGSRATRQRGSPKLRRTVSLGLRRGRRVIVGVRGPRSSRAQGRNLARVIVGRVIHPSLNHLSLNHLSLNHLCLSRASLSRVHPRDRHLASSKSSNRSSRANQPRLGKGKPANPSPAKMVQSSLASSPPAQSPVSNRGRLLASRGRRVLRDCASRSTPSAGRVMVPSKIGRTHSACASRPSACGRTPRRGNGRSLSNSHARWPATRGVRRRPINVRHHRRRGRASLIDPAQTMAKAVARAQRALSQWRGAVALMVARPSGVVQAQTNPRATGRWVRQNQHLPLPPLPRHRRATRGARSPSG